LRSEVDQSEDHSGLRKHRPKWFVLPSTQVQSPRRQRRPWRPPPRLRRRRHTRTRPAGSAAAQHPQRSRGSAGDRPVPARSRLITRHRVARTSRRRAASHKQRSKLPSALIRRCQFAVKPMRDLRAADRRRIGLRWKAVCARRKQPLFRWKGHIGGARVRSRRTLRHLAQDQIRKQHEVLLP